MDRPRIALTVGDPAGIGPEIVRALVRGPRLGDDELAGALRLLILGPERERPSDVPLVETIERADRGESDASSDVLWLPTDAPGPRESWETGRPQASSGRAALFALRAGADLARAGHVDALVTAPVSKEALHLAGEEVEGQTELLGRWAETPVEMLAVADNLRVLLLTRHLPLRAALAAITTESVLGHLALLDAGLRRLGIERPRLALAGLNPHAGENGILGSEERELLAPAVRAARAQELDVTGPESPDTVFLRASQGAFDGVLALYHDQAFIPVKLAAPRTGLTVLLGLPYLRLSPAHGTAFDIAGSGRADPANLRHALLQAALWAPVYSAAASAARA